MNKASASFKAAVRAAVRRAPPAVRFVVPATFLLCALALSALHAQFATAATGGDPPGLEQAQRSLLKTELASLKPRNKDTTNIYVLGIAGWADQDVFLKELDGALAAISTVLPIRGHWIRLVNHRKTNKSLPLANPGNFAAAVHELGARLDKEADIFLLVMTSHGNPGGFGLRLPSEAVTQLTPQDVAATFDREGIKNRVVIVSACFSGTFVPALANDHTIVLTASDAQSPSFGCAPERDWTYFGDALFHQSIRPGRDFQQAFESARMLVQGWELMDRARPSNPQAHFGAALVEKLTPLFRAQQAGN